MRKSIKTSFLSAVLCYNETNIKGLHEVQSQEVVIMTRGIRVKNTDDIQKINKIVTRYGFDIWIHKYKHVKLVLLRFTNTNSNLHI